MRPYLIALLLTVSCLLTACGLKLRSAQALPETFSHVSVISTRAHAPMQRMLERRLPVYQLQSIDPELDSSVQLNPQAIVSLRLQPEQLERRLLSVFSSGQVAEYELLFKVEYSVSFPDKPVIDTSVLVTREYQDDPDEVLAKSRELEIVLAEMRFEAADRMIRMLSSQHAGL